jgi:hypothetical protein
MSDHITTTLLYDLLDKEKGGPIKLTDPTLTPARVRSILSAAYSKFNEHVSSGAVRRDRHIVFNKYIVEPALTVFALLGSKFSANDTDMKWLFTEIVVMAECSASLLYTNEIDFNRFESTKRVRPKAIKINLRFDMPETIWNRLRKFILSDGPYCILATAEDWHIINNRDPNAYLNGLAEFQKYAQAVNFKVKLDSQQLNILKDFFRTEV